MRNAITKLLIGFLFAVPFVTQHQATANAAQQAEVQPMSTIPMLSQLSQISPNQLQVTYDQPVDNAKGMNPKNYWIQSTVEETPTGIATLGKNDNVNDSNSLTADKVVIQPMDNSGRNFVLTFKQGITKGMAYKMIICYVTRPGAPSYSGDNGSANFVGR